MTDHEHNHDVDLEFMYEQEWVQKVILQLMDWFRTNPVWFGLDQDEPKRVLDYACGNGTASIAIAQACKNITLRGIDASPSQIDKFNDTVRKTFGKQEDRFVAVVGDIVNGSSELQGYEWFDFDAAITSMALHHFPDPVDMLKRLRQRVKKGGVVLVADWLAGPDDAPASGHGHGHGASFHRHHNHDPKDMLEVVGGQKVWGGFTKERIKECFEAAGLVEFELKLDPKVSEVPEKFGGDKQLFYAKGVVP